MAQAFIQPDSPLDKYLRENQLEEEETTQTHHNNNYNLNNITNLLQSLLHPIIYYQPSLISSFQLSTRLLLQTLIPIQSITPSITHPSIQDETQLSERLKYLICSSFLLNPNLEPAFYNSQSSPAISSHIESFPHPIQNHQSTSQTTRKTNPLLTPQLLLSCLLVLLLLIFIRYLLSLSSLLISSLSILLISLALLSLPHSLFMNNTHSKESSPRETRLGIQSQLIPQVTQLINSSQALDLRLSRAIGAVKEIECVALGFGLSNPMPPISRLETANFPFSSTPSSTGADQSVFSTRDPSQQITLHALGVRKVLQRVLDQLRHDFETTAVELEAAIVNPAADPSEESPSTFTGRATLSALMEMYDCSRKPSGLETQSSLNNSATDRARRQAWRASLHAQNHENQNLSPSHLHLNPTSPSLSNPRRYSWQPSPPATRSVSETLHPNHLDMGKLSCQQARSRSSILVTTTSLLEHGPRGFPSSPHEDSHSLGSHHPPSRSRPLSVHLTAPASPSLFDAQDPSPLLTFSARSAKPRPVSMYAASPHGPPSSILLCPRKSIEPYPNILLEPADRLESTNQTPELPMTDRVVPYSLNALLSSFERMNISRKRLMCCLLALDFTSFISPTSVSMWQDTLEAVGTLLKTVEDLSTELTNGMTSEFGPGSFENTTTLPSDPSNSSDTFQVRGHRLPDHQPEEKSLTEVRNFGPPIPESEKKRRRLADLSNQMFVMDRALRTITAKIKVCMEELEKEEEGSENHGRRAITIHDSIRVDLECLAREWDESRSKIRTVVEGERVLIPGKSRLRNSLDSNDGSLSMSTSHGSSIYSSEILTPVSEDESIGLFETGGGEIGEEEDEEEEFDPIFSTIRSHQPMAPPPRLEEILRGVVMNETQAGSSRSSSSGSSKATPGAAGGMSPEETINNKPTNSTSSPSTATDTSNLATTRKPLRLTAEEYQELRKKRRESIPLTPRIQSRSRPHSLLSLAPSSSSSSSATSPAASMGVVTELKDVLISLQSKRLSTHR